MAHTTTDMRSGSSAHRWPDDPADDLPFRPGELEDYGRLPRKKSLGRRASRAIVRFLIIFGLGVAATLGWQAYGDLVREIIAATSPQLAWIIPQAQPPAARPMPEAVAAAPPATPSPDLQQVEAMSAGLAGVRQRVDQLAAQLAFNQQQTADQFARLQSIEQDILRKLSAPPPQQPAAPARKPAPMRLQPSMQQLPAR